MALTWEDEELIQRLAVKLKDEPLAQGSPLYVAVHQALDDDDPVWLMRRVIQLAGPQSVQLFSGFRGAGKTTELYRLKHTLETQEYFVVYVDALDYLNPSEPIDVATMLMVLAGSFSDAVAANQNIPTPAQSFWTRLTDWLKGLEIHFPEATLRAEVSTPAREVFGGLKAGIDIKAQLRDPSGFRSALQTFLAARISELKLQADHFIEQSVKLIHDQKGSNAQIVFIVDSLEQWRGTLDNWQSVIVTMQDLFTLHANRLKLPYVHAVYAVPPWLNFITRTEAPLTILPTVHLWKKESPERAPFTPAWDVLRDVVHRRISHDDGLRLFGPDWKSPNGPIDQLIGYSGGHARDLLRFLRDVLARATSLPVSRRVIDSTLNAARRDHMPIALDDARWLHEIGRTRESRLETIDQSSISRLCHFLDTHMVIYFLNGDAWYDLNPLIRDEVARLVAANPPAGP